MGLSERTFSPETNKSFRFLPVFIASCFCGNFIGLCFRGQSKKRTPPRKFELLKVSNAVFVFLTNGFCDHLNNTTIETLCN